MPLNIIDFQIEQLYFENSTQIILDGRILSGIIKVGMFFDFLELYCFKDKKRIELDKTKISLGLVEIIFYGRLVIDLSAGMTARLKLDILELDITKLNLNKLEEMKKAQKSFSIVKYPEFF